MNSRLIATLCALLIGYLSLNAKNIRLTEQEAALNGRHLCTDYIQSALDKCSRSGGGVVTLSPGRYLTGTIYLRNHVELHLERGAYLLGDVHVTDKNIYPKQALIYAEDIEDAGISGQGTIDGQSNTEGFLSQGFRVNDNKRPNGLFFYRCKNISFSDFNLLNAGNWTFRLQECDGVRINGIFLKSLAQGNNDGIDVDARNVVISNCILETDDDGICLKSDNLNFMPENITVSNCVIASNCNPIKFGTASCAGFRNVSISNCVIRRTTESNIWHWEERYDDLPKGVLTGLSGIAIESADGGCIEHVVINNITMEGVITPIFICLNRRSGGNKGIIRDIHISNITATCEGNIPSIISGIPDRYISDITLQNIHVEHHGGKEAMTSRLREALTSYPENRMFGRLNPAAGLFVRHAKNIKVEGLSVTMRHADKRPTVVADDVNVMTLRDLTSRNILGEPVQNIESTGITLDHKDIR